MILMSQSIICFVASSVDPASMNIANNLLEVADWEKLDYPSLNKQAFFCREINSLLMVIDSELVFTENFPGINFDVERFIFLSRHESAAKLPALLLHFTGNWTEDVKLGGNARSLGVSDPVLGKVIFTNLVVQAENAGVSERVKISLEATHHGPTSINKPLTFVEIGSDLEIWKNKKLGEVWANTLIEAIRDFLNRKTADYSVAIGFGGPHYAPNFTKVEIRSNIAMSHIAPKYVINDIDRDIIVQAIERSGQRPNLVLLDWKGLTNDQRKKLLTIFQDMEELNVLRTKDVLRR